MPSIPLRRLIVGLRVRYHLWIGQRAYRAGRIRVAGRHLVEAISRGHESFDAFLLMGKISFRERDLPKAAEFFHRARTSDPVRFSLEGDPDDFISALRKNGDQIPRMRYRITIEAERPRKAPRPREEVEPRRRRTLGDFTSHSEWLKYRDLPAFRPGEGTDIDWDDEARKLFDD